MGWMEDAESTNVSSRDPQIGLRDREIRVTGWREHNGHKGLSLILNAEVVCSDDPSRPPGFKVGFAITLSNPKYPEIGPKTAKALAAAMVGIDPGQDSERANREITKAVFASLLGPEQACAGVHLTVQTSESNKSDPKTGKPYINVRFGPVLDAEGMPKRTRGGASPVAPVPSVPRLPTPLAKVQPVFPPPGWAQHPDSTEHYYRGETVVTAAELRTLAATNAA